MKDREEGSYAPLLVITTYLAGRLVLSGEGPTVASAGFFTEVETTPTAVRNAIAIIAATINFRLFATF